MQQLHELQFRKEYVQSRRGTIQSRGLVCLMGQECLSPRGVRLIHDVINAADRAVKIPISE